jgi:hypothetical protein
MVGAGAIGVLAVTLPGDELPDPDDLWVCLLLLLAVGVGVVVAALVGVAVGWAL